MTKKLLYYYAIALQVLDGIFTYAGVETMGFGAHIEGNPIIKYLIEVLGPFTALAITKLAAIYIIIKCKNLFSTKILAVLCVFYSIAMIMWIIGFIVQFGLL